MGDYQAFLSTINQAVEALRGEAGKKVVVVCHDDADGIAAGAILQAALEKEGRRVELKSLEKVFPEAIDVILREKATIVFGDLATTGTRLLSKKNIHGNLIIILDHHQITDEVDDPRIYNINPERFGFSGSRDVSGASVCYLFAKTLNRENAPLSSLAVVGSCEIPGVFRSINLKILREAVSEGVIRGEGEEKKGYQIVLPDGKIHKLPGFFFLLNTLGPVGYYRGGPAAGIRSCLQGIGPEEVAFYDELQRMKKRRYGTLLKQIAAGGFAETEHIVWVDAGDIFAGMGTKVIGIFLSEWRRLRRGTKKYIIGMMDRPPEVPGVTTLSGEFKKVSVRLPDAITDVVLSGRLPSCSYLFRTAAKKNGGFGDGHQVAASAVVSVDKKESFIDHLEELIVNFIRSRGGHG